MKRTEIRCDECDNDLTYTGNCEDYYLTLGFASKSPWFVKDGLSGGAVTDMAITPPISRTHHFCNLGCMDSWRDRERHKDGLRNEWWEKWKLERGTKHSGLGGGIVHSYPTPSDAIMKERDAEIERAANAAFPTRGRRPTPSPSDDTQPLQEQHTKEEQGRP